MFSRSATSPSPSAATVSRAESPTTSCARCTGTPRSSPRRSATGAREYFGSGSPLGRPRCAVTITFAPASVSFFSVGSAARMRPSSVMVVPSSGTLKSERTRTRLPRRSPRESMVFMRSPTVLSPSCGTPAGNRPGPHMRTSACASPGGAGTRTRTHGATQGCAASAGGSELLADQGGQRDEAVRVAPLVVVPGDDLDLVADHLRELRVEDALVRVGDDVARDDLVLGVLQRALERAVGGGL